MLKHLSWPIPDDLFIWPNTRWPNAAAVLGRQDIAQMLLERASQRDFFKQRRVCKAWAQASERVLTQWYLWLRAHQRPVRILKTVTLKDQVLRVAIAQKIKRLDRTIKRERIWIMEYESALFEARAVLQNAEMLLVEACRWRGDLLAKPRKKIRFTRGDE